MKICFIVFLCFSLTSVFAFQEKAEIQSVINKMVEQGVITSEQAQEAIVRASDINKEKWSDLVQKAQETLKEGHHFQNQKAARSIASEN